VDHERYNPQASRPSAVETLLAAKLVTPHDLSVE
jgi:hypothetical protein